MLGQYLTSPLSQTHHPFKTSKTSLSVPRCPSTLFSLHLLVVSSSCILALVYRLESDNPKHKGRPSIVSPPNHHAHTATMHAHTTLLCGSIQIHTATLSGGAIPLKLRFFYKETEASVTIEAQQSVNINRSTQTGPTLLHNVPQNIMTSLSGLATKTH